MLFKASNFLVFLPGKLHVTLLSLHWKELKQKQNLYLNPDKINHPTLHYTIQAIIQKQLNGLGPNFQSGIMLFNHRNILRQKNLHHTPPEDKVTKPLFFSFLPNISLRNIEIEHTL